MPEVTLRPLGESDIAAHNSAEDAEIIRWLTGEKGTTESTRRHFAALAANAERGEGKRGFGVVVDGQLGGYIDCDPDNTDGLEPDESGIVNISYTTHAWTRRKGVATRAVSLICAYVRDQHIGDRAALRIEPDNIASIGVAERAGFRFERAFTSATDTHPDGTPTPMHLYLLDL